MNFQNNFATNLTSNTTAGATTTPLNSIPTIDAPFYLALDATNINAHYEVIYITSKTATNVLHAAATYAHTTAEEVRQINPASFLNAQQELAEGQMLNGEIKVEDTAGLTVSLKTKAGTDPSVTDPVLVMIAGTTRMVTSALSVAKADGTNWCNAGSSELATEEIDYFVYLGYNATDGVVIGFSRYPGANSYDDFSTTTTDEKYCAISTITNAAATDYYNVIGRFAATLSAGAGYTWSVPTFTAKNLIQRPIYETRWLDWASSYSASGSMTFTATDNLTKYKIRMNSILIKLAGSGTTGGTASNTLIASLPFSFVNGNYDRLAAGTYDTASIAAFAYSGTTNINVRKYDGSNYGLGAGRALYVSGEYEI